MFRSFTVGRIFGIPIKFDVTFLLILPIFAWVIGIQVDELIFLLNGMFDAQLDPDRLSAGRIPWLLGSLAAIGLFAGVVLHELGHSVVAIRYGYAIDSITLWLLGGLAQLTEQPRTWKHELWISIAGPVVSVVLGVCCYVVMIAMPVGFDIGRFVFGYLALINVVLAAFNMLPGFPMDGGRVLRALLARNRSFARATEIAAEVGKAFALGLGLVGLLWFNIIFIALAFFIYIAASGEARQTVVQSTLEGVTVRDVMTPASEVQTVDPHTSIEALVGRMFRERHTGYPVIESGTILGIVTFEDVQKVRPAERDAFRVGDVMSTEVVTSGPDTPAIDALTIMHQERIGRLLVTDEDGKMVGLLSRTDLMHAFTIISELKSFDLGEARIIRPDGSKQ